MTYFNNYSYTHLQKGIVRYPRTESLDLSRFRFAIGDKVRFKKGKSVGVVMAGERGYGMIPNHIFYMVKLSNCIMKYAENDIELL